MIAAVGEYACDDLITAITEGYSDPHFGQTTAVVFDARQSAANPSSEEIQQASRRILGQRPVGHIGKWAVVTIADPLRFGIARMGSLTMESLGVPVQVFTEMNSALEYVRGEATRRPHAG